MKRGKGDRRFQYGINVWVCRHCDVAVMIGKRCPVCGRSYADELKENSAPRPKEYPPKCQIDAPVREGKFFKSFFRKKESER